MSPPRISIVVPVHNAARFLPELFEALRQQRLTELQFVLVDDGSSDQSWALLNRFAAEEPRAVLCQLTPGQGAAAARNRGMAAAQGEWLGFCDADDLPHPEMYASLLAFAEQQQLELAYCQAERFSRQPGDGGQTMLRRPKPEQAISGPDWLMACHAAGEQIASACISLVRRSAVERGQVQWPQGSAIDDEIWTAELLLAVRRVAYLNRTLYYYRHNPDSCTRSVRPEQICRRIDGFAQVALHLWQLAATRDGALRRALLAIGNRNGLAAVGELRRLADSPLRQQMWQQLQQRGVVARLCRRTLCLKLLRRLLREKLHQLRHA